LGEDGLEVAGEEGAGVLEVLFGVGLGGGDARKRFVQQPDDPLLFGERRDGNRMPRRDFRKYKTAMRFGRWQLEDRRWEIEVADPETFSYLLLPACRGAGMAILSKEEMHEKIRAL